MLHLLLIQHCPHTHTHWCRTLSELTWYSAFVFCARDLLFFILGLSVCWLNHAWFLIQLLIILLDRRPSLSSSCTCNVSAAWQQQVVIRSIKKKSVFIQQHETSVRHWENFTSLQTRHPTFPYPESVLIVWQHCLHSCVQWEQLTLQVSLTIIIHHWSESYLQQLFSNFSVVCEAKCTAFSCLRDGTVEIFVQLWVSCLDCKTRPLWKEEKHRNST